MLKDGYKLKLSQDCAEVYSQWWQQQWSPAEGGLIGQGAIGAIKPTIMQEMWQGNMMFARGSLPPAGEKWLLYNPETKKAVVLSMGFEIGPGSMKFLGGSSVESHYVIGADNDSQLVVGKLKDQTVAYGPVECK